MPISPIARQLSLGVSHTHPACAPERLLAGVDPLLVARKGQLYLNAAEGASEDGIQTVVDAYYGDASYDVVPSLARALATDEAGQIEMAAVVQGTELYAVGGDDAGLWLAHRDEARDLLTPWRDADGRAWRVGRWRMMVNDVIILGTATLSELGAARIRKAALARRPLGDSARALSHASAKSRHARPPTTLLRMPGFAPVASVGNGPVRSKAVETPDIAPEARQRSGRSPIWTALILAAVLIGAAVVIGKPDLSRDGIMTSLAWVLTPVPTETPVATPTPTRPAVLPPEYRTAEAQATELAVERAAPLGTRDALATDAPATRAPAQSTAAPAQPTITPTPTRGEIPAPKLVYPSHDVHIDPTYLTLKWEWDGELGEDEYFDVRLWLMGGEKAGIAWTKQHQYIKRAADAGWHSWTVVVIRGKDGVVLEEISPEPAPVNFWWSVRGKTEKKDPTSVPLPTRDAPVLQPTRVSPGGE